MFSETEISVFLDELDEKIEILNENLLLMEKEEGNPELLQEIFRAAHTIKGSSAVMGYDRMSQLTHEMENIFDRLRQGTLDISSDLVDLLFESLDLLKSLRDEITGRGTYVDIETTVSKLREFASGQDHKACEPAAAERSTAPPAGCASNLTEAEEDVVRVAHIRGVKAYWVRVQVDPHCQMKSVRAFLVFETLQQYGEIIKSIPPAEDIEKGEYGDVFELVLLSHEDAGIIRNLLMTIAEIEAVTVNPIVLSDEQPGVSAVSELAEKTIPPDGVQKATDTAEAKGREEVLKQAKTVRVDVQKLDNLMNLVGELVIDRTRLERFVEILQRRYGTNDLVEVVDEISTHLVQLTNDLQEEIMKARMLPIAQVFNRFPRMVRDLAHKLGKEIDFIVEGKETELDRNVIEVIGDPLIHLLRNAVDHGIERPEERAAAGKAKAGTILLKAYHHENHIVIIAEDDGRGIDVNKVRRKAVERSLVDEETAARLPDAEVLNYLFLPGFSLSREITDLSGRGVGLDVVKKNIEQINGFLEMSSVLGQGTKFTVKLPLTLAIIRALMVSIMGQVYAFPLANVMETMHVSRSDVRRVRNAEVIAVRGKILPLICLSALFNGPRPQSHRLSVVVAGIGERRVGVIVDELLGEQEIVIKSLGDYLGRVPGISGATILGDGRVALIIDVRALLREAAREVTGEALYAAG
ncbi:MAG TPA: chemotaxis protein CheA [Desulfotomaculum sp.]|nr:chemotaxis protein CheA [Desulfotomaculum sp.]